MYATPVYEELLQRDADAIGFTLRTVSLVSDVEVHFDDQNPDQYDLFNVGYLILPATRPAPQFATLIASAGRHRLYRVPTTGYLEVVDTVAPAIKADRRTMAQQPAAFLNSPLLAQRRFPTVAFAGAPPAAPTLAPGDDPEAPAGKVLSQYSLPDEGQFGGIVQASRPSVVLLKATYQPRWSVTVDGHTAKTQMVSPGLVAVRVPAGPHRVEFRYRAYHGYIWLFLVGALTLLGLALAPRLLPRLRDRGAVAPVMKLPFTR